MPVQQRCTVAGMTQLNPTTYWMVLEVGNMVEELGLRAGQFLHVACGEANLLRRPISVALAYPDEPEDTAALIFEVKGEGTRWLARRQVGDTVDVLGPLGNGFAVENGPLPPGGGRHRHAPSAGLCRSLPSERRCRAGLPVGGSGDPGGAVPGSL